MADKNKKAKPAVEKIAKKEISQGVYEKLISSLSEYNLQGKKFHHRLKKVSKLLAGDIAKANRKQAKLKTKKIVATK